MEKNNKPESRKENIVVQEYDGEVLIYDLVNNRAFCLNQTSALVWQSCDGKRTIAEINDLLGKRLNSQINEDVVWLALDQLSKENLLEETDLPNKFKGLKRREIIKKIGFASAVTLPVIAALTAPVAAGTATCVSVVGGCSCGLTGNTPSGTFCMPAGAGAMNCANTACRCLSMGFGNPDDCVP